MYGDDEAGGESLRESSGDTRSTVSRREGLGAKIDGDVYIDV